MNQHFIPDIWCKFKDEANSVTYHVVFEIKKCAAVLAAEDDDHRSGLNSMVERLTKANEILGEMVEHQRSKINPPELREMVERQQPTIDPPGVAEFLLTALLKPSHADAVTGDLNEHFTRECEELGRRRAIRLYWARTLRSLWPLLKRAAAKALKWGAVIATVRRLF